MTFSHLLIINVTYKEANMSLFKRFVYIVTKNQRKIKELEFQNLYKITGKFNLMYGVKHMRFIVDPIFQLISKN